jgi:serine/threonine protein kinase
MKSMSGYELGKPLHLGERSEAYTGVRERDDLEVVLKRFRATGSAGAEQRARQELAMLQNVLERVHGLTLDAWLRARAPDVATLLDVFVQLVTTLSRVHAARSIHRDIGHANLIVDPETSRRVERAGQTPGASGRGEQLGGERRASSPTAELSARIAGELTSNTRGIRSSSSTAPPGDFHS